MLFRSWVERGARVRREVGIPVAVSWNLGVPQNADRAIRDDKIDLVLLGRPALSNPHWPVWAARELGHQDPFGLVPEDWAWWLRNFRGHDASIGWPEVPETPAVERSALRSFNCHSRASVPVRWTVVLSA